MAIAAGQQSPLGQGEPASSRLLRIRTLTAGVPLTTLDDLAPVRAALDGLTRARERCVAAGYEVQTIRIALPPLIAAMTQEARDAARPALVALDTLVAGRGAVVSLGPVLMEDRADPMLATWAMHLVTETRVTSFSVMVATPDHQVLPRTCRTAAEIVRVLAATVPGGVANFRFAAAACVPAGTPFFPVAWHDGPASLAVGCETPRLLLSALAERRPGTRRRHACASSSTANWLRWRRWRGLLPTQKAGAIAASTHRRRPVSTAASVRSSKRCAWACSAAPGHSRPVRR